jgi:type I restriction enzyme, S subunit
MISDWPTVRLGDEINLQRGIDITKRQQRAGSVPVVSSGGISSYHDTAYARAPGVVIGRKGTLGGVYFLEEDYWPHDTTLWVTDFRGNDAKFVYYFLRWIAPRLTVLDVGTANPTLNRNHVHPIRVSWPPVNEQRAIAAMLGALDDKIELNHQMNQTLEALAATIFRSWFVDFDPVIAKIEGRAPFGMSADVAALFPSVFEDSEDGRIPSRWETGDVYRVADVIYGAPFKSPLFNTLGNGLPLIRIRDLATHDPEVFTPESPPRGYVVQPGDLIVGMDGEFRAHLWRGPEAWLNQRVCCFKPKPGVPRAFVQYSIDGPLSFFEASNTGTTVIHLGKGDIDTFRVLVPPPGVLTAFARLVEPLDKRIIVGSQESSILIKLRDTLLPKLLAGEIRVRQAERALVEA